MDYEFSYHKSFSLCPRCETCVCLLLQPSLCLTFASLYLYTGLSLVCACAYKCLCLCSVHACVCSTGVCVCVSLPGVPTLNGAGGSSSLNGIHTCRGEPPLLSALCCSLHCLHPHPIICHHTPIVSLYPQSITHHTEDRPRIDSGLHCKPFIWH